MLNAIKGWDIEVYELEGCISNDFSLSFKLSLQFK